MSGYLDTGMKQACRQRKAGSGPRDRLEPDRAPPLPGKPATGHPALGPTGHPSGGTQISRTCTITGNIGTLK